MSYYDNDDDNNRRNRRDQVIVEETSYPASKVWLWGFCCLVIITLVIFFVVSIIYWTKDDNFHHHMTSIISEMTLKNTAQSDTKNMISFSALSIIPSALSKLTGGGDDNKPHHQKLSLCHSDILKSNTNDIKTTTLLISATDQLSDNKEPNYYAIDLKITMDFNVDVSTYILNSQRLDTSQFYMTISYLITSSYTQFSTIKLIETGLDITKKTLVNTNSIILCSNNPLLNSKSCKSTENGGNNNINTVLIKNTILVVMAKQINGGIDGYGKNKNNTKKNPITNGDDHRNNSSYTQSINANQFNILHSDSSINKYKLEEDFTKDIRMYNLVFYQSNDGGDGGGGGGGGGDQYDTTNDNIILTIKPNKCK